MDCRVRGNDPVPHGYGASKGDISVGDLRSQAGSFDCAVLRTASLRMTILRVNDKRSRG